MPFNSIRQGFEEGGAKANELYTEIQLSAFAPPDEERLPFYPNQKVNTFAFTRRQEKIFRAVYGNTALKILFEANAAKSEMPKKPFNSKRQGFEKGGAKANELYTEIQ